MSILYFSSYLNHGRTVWIHIRCSWLCFRPTWLLANTIYLQINHLSPFTGYSPTFKVSTLTSSLLPFLLWPEAQFLLKLCWPTGPEAVLVKLGPDKSDIEKTQCWWYSNDLMPVALPDASFPIYPCLRPALAVHCVSIFLERGNIKTGGW